MAESTTPKAGSTSKSALDISNLGCTSIKSPPISPLPRTTSERTIGPSAKSPKELNVRRCRLRNPLPPSHNRKPTSGSQSAVPSTAEPEDLPVDCDHRGERAIKGDVLMQIGIISDLGTTPRNPVGVRVDGSSARRAGMRSRNGLRGSLGWSRLSRTTQEDFGTNSGASFRRESQFNGR